MPVNRRQRIGNDHVEVRWKALPRFVVARLEIRPRVVEVERKAGIRLHRGLPCGVAWRTCCAAAFANAMLRSTLRVASSICAAVASVMPGTDVANGGGSYGVEAMGKGKTLRTRDTRNAQTPAGSKPGIIRISAE